MQPLFILIFLLIMILLFIFAGIHATKQYKNTGYEAASGHSFYETMTNPGRNGEYLIYRCLKVLGDQHKVLTNIYLPKEDGTTTEIDLIMISATSIYVFESKNYSGWIFGDESSKFWTQSLKGGKSFASTIPSGRTRSTSAFCRNTWGLEAKCSDPSSSSVNTAN